MWTSFIAVILVAAASPLPATQSWSSRDTQFYSLRANCPNEPWHGRHLVVLPTGDRLGLENFTTYPETPPLRFFPVRIPHNDNKYALRGDGFGDDLSRTPYLAALTNSATRTVSMKIVYLPTPLRESFEAHTDACPPGYDCTADQWILNDLSPASRTKRVYPDLEFGGFKGSWEPFKDAGGEGWHVYWKGNAGVRHPVQFDLVPVAWSSSSIASSQTVRQGYVPSAQKLARQSCSQ